MGNLIVGDNIGTNAAGTVALGNGNNGVIIVNGASQNSVSSNVIAGNRADGIQISDLGTMGNCVTGTTSGPTRR